MNCTEVKYYLNDYARGILLNEVRADIHEHLNCCKSCAKALDKIFTVSSQSSVKKKNAQSEDKVWERIHDESEKNNSTNKITPKIFPSVSTISAEADQLKNSLMLKAN